MRVQIAVTHLLGTGHLARALVLARAFQSKGHEVEVLSGGMPAPNLDRGDVTIKHLPALRSNGTNFSELLTDLGDIADASYLRSRRDRACQLLAAFEPDVLITELFPFGRRSLRAEFTAMLDTAAGMNRRPIVLSSIRDILAPPSKPAKAAQTLQTIVDYYDAVLVHSDPTATRLEVSWPVSDALSAKLQYTGYVAPSAPVPHPEQDGRGEILVSAGGGDVGTHLFRCAVEAATLRPDRTWRILVGGAKSAELIQSLKRMGSPAVIEPARPDFRQMLCHASASISMCGYNTTLDLLQTGVPAVIVPFDDGNEVEQTLRAQSLAQLDGIETLKTRDLTPQRLCDLLDTVTAAPRRDVGSYQFDGAARTLEIAEDLLDRRA
ncbi:glycosyltransferase [Phaeobacter sp.]|uniref:glycosyltransferase family protein n=1 Tax=Phaeobacter sp. TaxID=1902409 RepID=UPI0025D1BFB2|nr:glycosyltransferase [Phaeobacter sp.]